MIDSTEDSDSRKTDIDKLLRTYATAGDTVYVYCNECGALTTENCFNCNICSAGEFGLCPGCCAQKNLCYDSEHLPTKRIMRNEHFVDVP